MNVGIHKRREIYSPNDRISASQEELYFFGTSLLYPDKENEYCKDRQYIHDVVHYLSSDYCYMELIAGCKHLPLIRRESSFASV
jgi:hypothetical protein